MVPVQISNAVSQHLLTLSLNSACFAASAAMFTSPIGVLGGAYLGAIYYVAEIPLSLLANKILNASHPEATAATKLVAAVFKFFASYVAAWKMLSLAGHTLTLTHAISLGVMSSFLVIPIGFLLGSMSVMLGGCRFENQ